MSGSASTDRLELSDAVAKVGASLSGSCLTKALSVGMCWNPEGVELLEVADIAIPARLGTLGRGGRRLFTRNARCTYG